MSNNRTKGWDGEEKIKYLDFCEKAVTDENLFNTFKQNPNYTSILEHVHSTLAYAYYALLEEEYKNLIPLAAKLNDVTGTPSLISTPQGSISGTTLRYLKVLQDLDKLDSLNGAVVEIGAGYGGQARIILGLSKNKKKITNYITVDLLGPSLLQAKYNSDIKKFKSVDFDVLTTLNPDFVISNYAFSELPKVTQQVYLEKIILNATNGYITYNPGAGWELSYKELFSKLTSKNFQIQTDSPMNEFGYPDNKIITW